MTIYLEGTVSKRKQPGAFPMATHGLALTAEVAARGKLSAVRARFYSDPYVACFLPSLPCPCPSLGAMINTGQYARVAAIGSVIEQFMRLAPPQSAQIVSLGAGLDTRFWQLHDSALLPARYIELDQPCVVEAKARAIASSPQLLAALPGGAACCSESGVASVCYSCIGVDLCDLSKLDDALQSAQWDSSAPTLVIAECLLVYMKPAASGGLLRYFGERCTRAVFTAYEQAASRPQP